MHFKTDNRQLFLWSLEQLVQQKWQITELSFDLHESDLPQNYKITTHYERTFMAQGIPINYVTARPPKLAR
jgi:tRNA (guanine-N7-)-methyltransferase